MKKAVSAVLAVACLACASDAAAAQRKKPPPVAPWRVQLRDDWRALPMPPVTPYDGPFGYNGRAFIPPVPAWALLGREKERLKWMEAYPKEMKAFREMQKNGTYTVEKDPRKIDLPLEKAILEDWRRMGYNAAYKFGLPAGRWLKKHGMLGAIDQTLWGAWRNPPIHYDGKPGKIQREGCGSFFVRYSYDAGVSKLSGMVTRFGDLDMFKVGRTYITCSWDEVGMRTRHEIDYHPKALAEYIKYLQNVWFQDKSPGADSNGDGRTYNQFTGENLKDWKQVRPPILSSRYHTIISPVDEKWKKPGVYKLWLDFHRYYTFEFFRRINEDVSRRLSDKAYAKASGGAGKKPDPRLREKTRIRLECYPFPQAFLIWPGINAFWGMSVYWNHRLNPIINVEQCWPEHPAMAVNYAMTDHLARKYKNLIMGWSWFYPRQHGPGYLYDGPGDIERALARMMGHRVDGIHHWLYAAEYRGSDEAPLRQRKQLAYWHNFFGRHYATFLSKSEPVPAEVALLLPDYSGYFYPQYNYPKFDYVWTAQALLEAQIPFEIVTEEELECDPNVLNAYKVLYVVGSEWSTPTIRKRIDTFLGRGGKLFANVDSLSLDIPSGKRTAYLEKTLGVKLTHKYKNPFYPSIQTPEEWQWAQKLTNRALPRFQGYKVHLGESKLWKKEGGKYVRNDTVWKKMDGVLAQMPKTGAGGLAQSAIDMRNPPRIKYAEGMGPVKETVTYGDICVGDVVKGKPIAWYGGKVCGVETKNTVWLGTRPGASLHALYPRVALARGSEPCNPFVTNVPDLKSHGPYIQILSHAAKKAGVKRLVTVSKDGAIPVNLEVLPRADKAGNLMVVVINHDGTDALYQVAIASDYLNKKQAMKKAVAWNLLKNEEIEKDSDGRFDLKVPPHRVVIFFMGSGKVLQPIKEAQAKLNALDTSVPKYLQERVREKLRKAKAAKKNAK